MFEFVQYRRQEGGSTVGCDEVADHVKGSTHHQHVRTAQVAEQRVDEEDGQIVSRSQQERYRQIACQVWTASSKQYRASVETASRRSLLRVPQHFDISDNMRSPCKYVRK